MKTVSEIQAKVEQISQSLDETQAIVDRAVSGPVKEANQLMLSVTKDIASVLKDIAAQLPNGEPKKPGRAW